MLRCWVRFLLPPKYNSGAVLSALKTLHLKVAVSTCLCNDDAPDTSNNLSPCKLLSKFNFQCFQQQKWNSIRPHFIGGVVEVSKAHISKSQKTWDYLCVFPLLLWTLLPHISQYWWYFSIASINVCLLPLCLPQSCLLYFFSRVLLWDSSPSTLTRFNCFFNLLMNCTGNLLARSV